jgi:predicted enzyme involved in methoxymalonyl-ACP biosynthesis
MDCSDRFGDYGTIGFCIVERSGPRMVDLMFSCRIQSKRVEHAFLVFLLKTWKNRGANRFQARFARTERNQQAGQVFADLGFTAVETHGNVFLYSFKLAGDTPAQDIVTILWEGKPW